MRYFHVLTLLAVLAMPGGPAQAQYDPQQLRDCQAQCSEESAQCRAENSEDSHRCLANSSGGEKSMCVVHHIDADRVCLNNFELCSNRCRGDYGPERYRN